MRPIQIRNSLQNALDLMSDNKLSLFNLPIRFDRNNRHTRITWQQTPGILSKPQQFGTLEQYFSIIKDNSFSSLLFDGSILRFSYNFHRNDLVSHNLWYYPCPLKIPYNELQTEPLLEIVKAYSEGGTDYWCLKGPLRFDFDEKRAEAIKHPATHVHFHHSECRIPAKEPLSPGKFIKFVFSSFYPLQYDKHSFLRELPEEDFNKSIVPQEEEMVHFSWRRQLGSHLAT